MVYLMHLYLNWHFSIVDLILDLSLVGTVEERLEGLPGFPEFHGSVSGSTPFIPPLTMGILIQLHFPFQGTLQDECWVPRALGHIWGSHPMKNL